MKKNKTLRLASALLILVLLTTGIVGSTFAKYVTTGTASDTARVAKWGVELKVAGNLYGDTYKDTIVKQTDSTMTVKSVDKADNVVAPGTKNEGGFTFSLKGEPEVAGTVTTNMKIQNVFLAAGSYGVMIPVGAAITADNFGEFADLYYLDGITYKIADAWKDNTDYYTLENATGAIEAYYPVVYSLTGSTVNTGTAAADSLKAAAAKIATALGLTAGTTAADTSITYTGTKSFAANDNLADLKIGGVTLSWTWGFGTEAINNNEADTILGMLENTTDGKVVKKTTDGYAEAVKYIDYCLETCFELGITVAQAD